MVDTSGLTIGLAFFAGLASFLSPCVFALVPAYVGYLSGRSVAAAESQDKTNSLVTLSHGFAFVLGFSVVFIILGIMIGAISSVMDSFIDILVQVGGIVVIIFGLHMLRILKISYLNYDLRPQSSPDRKRGYASSAMMGVFFSAGWAPCIGPVLGLIFTLVINGGSVITGVTLLAAYSAGLAVPFLLAATQIGWVTTILRRYNKVMLITEKIMGVVLVVIGALLFLGRFETILAPLSGNFFFSDTELLLVGRLLLLGFLTAILIGLIPGSFARRQGKNFIDWWFLGTGASLVLLVALYAFGVLDFLVPLIT
ncbi:MAG: cytochrome c biogenesis protein CcdA [Chloroflexi bacterium]|nr:cytochrome c biogenesis protein CcdA [Chloroflexota bacterium]